MPYSRSSSPFDQISNYIRRSQIPATLSLIAVCVVLFLFNFFPPHLLSATPFFAFEIPIASKMELIALFTYPFLNDFLTTVFGVMWLFWVGGSLERSWGSGKFLLFFLLMTPISGLGLVLGSTIFHSHNVVFLLGGLWLPLTSVTVAWAAINPYVSILLYGLIPVQARWIAIFEVGVIYFVYYSSEPFMGLFVLAGALSAFLVVKLGLMTATYRGGSGPDLRIVSGGQNKRRPLDDAGMRVSLNPLNRFRAWQQRRKLAKLLQKSGFSDRDDDKRRR
jgi:hypothetical protein